MFRNQRRIPGEVLLLGIPLSFFGLLFFYPLGAIVQRTVFPDGHLELSFVWQILSDRYLRGVLSFTVGQALLSAILTVGLGLPLGYLLGRYRFRGRHLCMVLFTIPFMLPAVVVAVGFRSLFGPGTILGNAVPIAGTFWIILLAHIYYNLGLVIRLTASFWSHLSPVYAEAARVLGASKLQRWRRVYLPLMLPVILGSLLLVFLYCFGSFGIILLLGGQGMSSIEVEIYRSTVNLLDFKVAGGLALYQLATTLSLGLLYRRISQKFSVPLEKVPPQEAMKPLSGSRYRFQYGGLLAFAMAVILAPLEVIVSRAFFQDGHVTWRFVTELFYNRSASLFYISPLVAMQNSLVFAGGTALLAVALAMIVIYVRSSGRGWREHSAGAGRMAEALVWLPLGTSAVTLGLGFMLSPLFRGAGWIGSPLSIISLHTVIAFPFVLAVLLPAYRSIDQSLLEAASVLGAGVSVRFRRIIIPLLGKAIVVAVCYSLLMSLGEFGATLMVTRPETMTVPLAINRLLSQPGTLNFGKAMAESTMLITLAAFLVWTIERFSQEGENT